MKLKLSFLALTLTLLSVNAYAFQVADSRYEGTYNSVDLNTVQTTFNGIRSRGAGGGAPVGTIVAVPSHAVDKFLAEDPDAWLPCDGVSTAGTALETIMTVTPNLNGADGQPKRFLQGTTETSGMVAAGLPNIEGSFKIDHAAMHSSTGAINTQSYRQDIAYGQYMRYYGATVTFDASRYSDVFGKSETVQPAAYTVRYYIRCNE